MRCPHFRGKFKYPNKHQATTPEETSEDEFDVFEMISIALTFKLSLEDLKNMSFVSFANIIDTIAESITKESQPQPTQEQINAIT